MGGPNPRWHLFYSSLSAGGPHSLRAPRKSNYASMFVIDLLSFVRFCKWPREAKGLHRRKQAPGVAHAATRQHHTNLFNCQEKNFWLGRACAHTRHTSKSCREHISEWALLVAASVEKKTRFHNAMGHNATERCHAQLWGSLSVFGYGSYHWGERFLSPTVAGNGDFCESLKSVHFKWLLIGVIVFTYPFFGIPKEIQKFRSNFVSECDAIVFLFSSNLCVYLC